VDGKDIFSWKGGDLFSDPISMIKNCSGEEKTGTALAASIGEKWKVKRAAAPHLCGKKEERMIKHSAILRSEIAAAGLRAEHGT